MRHEQRTVVKWKYGEAKREPRTRRIQMLFLIDTLELEIEDFEEWHTKPPHFRNLSGVVMWDSEDEHQDPKLNEELLKIANLMLPVILRIQPSETPTTRDLHVALTRWLAYFSALDEEYK